MVDDTVYFLTYRALLVGLITQFIIETPLPSRRIG
jgi:hypothetical protein